MASTIVEIKNEDPLALFRKFITEYKLFQDKSDKYMATGELEGALINYTLAANSLRNAMYIRNTDKTMNNFLIKNAKMNNWCDEVCDKLDEIQADVLSKIGPLQEELKKRKTYTGSNGRKEEDDANNCDNIFSKQIVLKGNDCIFFDDVIGQEPAKIALKNGFIWPNVYSNLYPKIAKGVLFYGPPGTGKSYLAKAAANEMNLPKYDENLHILYFAPQGGDLKGKYVGETEKNIQKYFKCASDAAEKCQNDKNESEEDPERKGKHRVLSIIFLDEVDAIAGDRTQDSSGMMSLSVNALLQALDGLSSKPNVSVIAATNFPWDLDSAFLRRFDSKILIDIPSANDIYNIIQKQINDFITKIEIYNSNPQQSIETYDRQTTKKGQLTCGTECTQNGTWREAQFENL